MKEAQLEFEKNLQISESEYQKFIETKRNEIVQFHLENNTFYKNLVGNTDVSDWNNLPILTKKNLQVPLVERLSKGFEKNIYINKTSGSSGDPFIFAKDKFSHALTWYSNIYRFVWFGIDFNTSLQARFYGIPLDKFGYYKERFKRFFSEKISFSDFRFIGCGFGRSSKKIQTEKIRLHQWLYKFNSTFCEIFTIEKYSFKRRLPNIESLYGDI